MTMNGCHSDSDTSVSDPQNSTCVSNISCKYLFYTKNLDLLWILWIFYKNIHSYQIGYRLSQWSFNYCIFSASIFGLTGLKSKEGTRKKSTVITIEKPNNDNQQKFDLSKFLPLQCQSCNRRFPNEAILQWHISTQHESTGKFF